MLNTLQLKQLKPKEKKLGKIKAKVKLNLKNAFKKVNKLTQNIRVKAQIKKNTGIKQKFNFSSISFQNSFFH